MYGLPPDFDASIFVGRELEQVSFSANTVHLTFDDDIAITLESSFLFQTDKTQTAVKQEPPVQSSSIMSLVGRRVCSARSTSDGTLTLQFTGDGTFTCVDDSEEYESYHIWFCGKEIVV